MAEERKISVIIPVFNTEKFVERCVRSILNNTYKNLEVICVNDGSKDKSLEILNKLAEEDSRVVVIDKENGGVSSARNAGLDAATGDFISFVDSDDWIHPQFFEILIYYQEKNGSKIVAADFENVNAFKDFKKILTYDLPSEEIDVCRCFEVHFVRKNIWSRIIFSELLNGLYFPEDIKLSEDSIFSFQVIANLDKEDTITYVKKPLYFYYMNESSAMHTLPASEYSKSAEWYLKHIEKYNDVLVKTALLEQAYKNFLVIRYMGRYEAHRKFEKNYFKQQLKQCRKYNELLSLKNRLLFNIFSFFPFTYRLFRIITDPTMIKWEKEQKKNLRELKKNEKN